MVNLIVFLGAAIRAFMQKRWAGISSSGDRSIGIYRSLDACPKGVQKDSKEMTKEILQLLKVSQAKVVKIRCADGEILVARVSFVSVEDEDVIYDLVSTNQEDRYKRYGRRALYTVRFHDIISVEPMEEPPPTDDEMAQSQ